MQFINFETQLALLKNYSTNKGVDCAGLGPFGSKSKSLELLSQQSTFTSLMQLLG